MLHTMFEKQFQLWEHIASQFDYEGDSLVERRPQTKNHRNFNQCLEQMSSPEWKVQTYHRYLFEFLRWLFIRIAHSNNDARGPIQIFCKVFQNNVCGFKMKRKSFKFKLKNISQASKSKVKASVKV